MGKELGGWGWGVWHVTILGWGRGWEQGLGKVAVKGPWNAHLTSPPAAKCLRNVHLTCRLAVKYQNKFAFNRPAGG